MSWIGGRGAARVDAAAVAAVSALAEPARRRLYDYVCDQAAPVGRDDAAAALGMPRATAAFHLDRLAEVGLLAVQFARRTGRRGPGAGRPAKLYRRGEREIAVALPERSYALAGQLLAQALDDTLDAGAPAASARSHLARRAGEFGHRIGAEAGDSDDEIMAALAAWGFEPRREGTDIVLGNCPFHLLASQHTELVCGMNHDLIGGVLDGAHCARLRATLAPADGRCCVRLEPVG